MPGSRPAPGLPAATARAHLRRGLLGCAGALALPTAGADPRAGSGAHPVATSLAGHPVAEDVSRPILLQVDFPCPGPWGDKLTASFRHMADSISAEPGLKWKIWTQAPEMGEAGGIYLFDTLDAAEMYLEKHRERLAAEGFVKITPKLLEVNEALSALTRAPLCTPEAVIGMTASGVITSRRRPARSGNRPARPGAGRRPGRSCRAPGWFPPACSGCRRAWRGRPAG